MRPLVLCSNDDGIHAPYLEALAQRIEAFADVIVVAPERQRSAASHAITLHKPLRLTEVENFLRGPLGAERLDAAADMPVSLVASRTRQEYRRDVVRGFMLRGLINAARRAGADPGVLAPELEAAYA